MNTELKRALIALEQHEDFKTRVIALQKLYAHIRAMYFKQ